jgi:hypothetical protein
MCVEGTLKKRERERGEHSLNKKMENYLRSLLLLRVRGGEGVSSTQQSTPARDIHLCLHVCERRQEREME